MIRCRNIGRNLVACQTKKFNIFHWYISHLFQSKIETRLYTVVLRSPMLVRHSAVWPSQTSHDFYCRKTLLLLHQQSCFHVIAH